ncbi:glycosyltransferase family 1 protein [Abortiporus biennis]|nr:glycosyltransferase family 1 protein [Abortiporus biennis]
MRAGTQTLIQALQAIPWLDSEDQDNDEDLPHDTQAVEEESDEDEKPAANWLASSIHTIYRPVARSRLKNSRRSDKRSSKLQHKKVQSMSDIEDETQTEEPVLSDEEIEEDFEPMRTDSPIPHNLGESESSVTNDVLTSLPALDASESGRIHPPRQGSMATVKLERRARLAQKLTDIFEIKGIEEVIAEMPCWLLRSVLLQGYLYLTDSYLCFFAHLPSREDQVLKSGTLSKRAQRTKRWIKHWFILKNDVLSWYQSSSDPYFPHGVVDLRYAITCEPAGDKDIRLRTNQKSIRLSADSVPSRDEWVKAIRKVMFKAQNMGDSIAIPYSAIVDVDRSTAMDFSETIEIKVVDKADSYSMDSYFLAYFHDISAALEQIREAVRSYRSQSESSTPSPLIDTTVARSPASPNLSTVSRAQTSPPGDTPSKPSTGFRLTSLLRPLQESLPIGRTISAPVADAPESNEEFTHISKRNSVSFVPLTTSPKGTMIGDASVPNRPPLVSETSSSSSITPTASYISNHTYPPSSSSLPSTSELGPSPSTASSWGVGVPSWLKMPSRRVFGSPFSSRSADSATASPAAMSPDGRNVSEVLTSNISPSSSRISTGEYGFFSILEKPAASLDPEVVEKFRNSFAFDEKEKLLGHFPGYIFRLLPVYGHLFISTNYFCFRSSGPLTSRTRMMLPLRDILSTEPSKAFRFGHYGLVVIVRGHEELFFEFSDDERRQSFAKLLEQQIENIQRRGTSGERSHSTDGQREALILEEFGPRTPKLADSETVKEPDPMTESLPAVMFTSTSSTFLTFKPKESLHFTFLTIGSRGDVQPYISLAKGLIADGHRCRIATHGEFKDWIESYGIEFGYVGGDPAELMRICVENGTFTVAFLKEGMQKFRGWIDDLLQTSWEACQGTDVLVESPSAMAGYHIAEALRIPYFRAFTMTWTRTRAYPHAFAVPEHKMGGNYNYMTYVLFDQVFWRGTAGQINRWRRNTLGLSPTSLDKMEPHKIPFLYNFSPVVVPLPLDWPEWIRITGYWFLDDANVSASKWTPPPDLLEFIDTAHKAKKKVVYIGFGSIVVSDPKAMTRTVIDAIVQSGVYAILSKGWSDRLVKTTTDVAEVSEPLPKQIYAISSIPHDWLFKRIDAACHHGGAGTTGASLRAGIPTIIKPFFGDQYFWADRVEALGIGSAVRKLSVASLTEALMAATTDIKQIERAKVVGEKIRSENGVATAIEAIYRDLEYARSLIKGTPASLETRDLDPEGATIRERFSRSSSTRSRPSRRSGDSDSPRGAQSDWSVISDQEDSRPSTT